MKNRKKLESETIEAKVSAIEERTTRGTPLHLSISTISYIKANSIFRNYMNCLFNFRRTWSRTVSAPSTCCEEELKVWNSFRKRLASDDTNIERRGHMTELESRISQITEKGCCLYQTIQKSRKNLHVVDIKTSSLGNIYNMTTHAHVLVIKLHLGRRTRAGQHRTANDLGNECESRGPLMECMKILNTLAKDLHDEENI